MPFPPGWGHSAWLLRQRREGAQRGQRRLNGQVRGPGGALRAAGRGGPFNWRLGLPLKPRQPIRAGARTWPANPSTRLPPPRARPGPEAAVSERGPDVSAAAPAAQAAHICPLGGRNPSPRPSPLKDNGPRVGRAAGPRDSFRSKGSVIKQEGGGIFRELGPKINSELCSPPPVLPCRRGAASGGRQVVCSRLALAGLSQTWAHSPVAREEVRVP